MTIKISELIVDNIEVSTYHAVPEDCEIVSIETTKAEQQLKEYFKEEWLKLVGEDHRVHCAVCGSEALPKSICSSGVCLIASARNEEKAELRQAIDKWER